MRQEASSPPAAVLHFWNMLTFLTSVHESVEAAVEEAYILVASHTAIPDRITATDGTVLMDSKALTEAVVRFGDSVPI